MDKKKILIFSRYLPNFAAMFSFPSAIPRLWGGALILLDSVNGDSTGTGLLFSFPDHLSTPQQISIDYSHSFLTSGFAGLFSDPSREFFFVFVSTCSFVTFNS